MTMEGTTEGSSVESTSPELQGQEGGEQSPPQQQQQQPRDDFSKRFELLTRKEREIMEREHRFKSQESKYRDIENRYKEYEQDKELASYDPIGFMQKYGWTPEKLAEHMQNNPMDPYAIKYQKRIDDLENRLKQMDESKTEERRREVYNRQINNIRSMVEQNADKYELIKENDAHTMVFDVMAEYFSTYQENLSPEKAAQVVENYLEQQLERVINLKKTKAKFGAIKPPESDQEGGSNQQAPIRQQTRPSTLTNSFAPVNAPTATKAMTREESLARAAKLVKWND